MDANDPEIVLPEERGQRSGYVIVPAAPRASVTSGMSRDEILEAVNRRKRGEDLN
ncbi:MAG: hypothetical protein JO257_03515 [Deltaproteobacteria bacterium]|nr:hypothetical protein [Deltaproteobacteria bacterium]